VDRRHEGEVLLGAEGNTPPGSLTDGGVYYVRLQADGTVLLYDSKAHALAGGNTGLKTLGTTGTGTDQKLIISLNADGSATTKTATFNPTGTTNFVYTPTPLERATLTASIKEWTPNELLYAFGAGLLKNVTDTVPNPKDPDIVADNVTLQALHTVGESGGSDLIDLSVQPFSKDDRIALAAAERLDVQFLAAAPVNAQVNFAGNTITRIDGGDWSAFAVGEHITIDGNGQVTQNATNLNLFPKITKIGTDGLGRAVLTVDLSQITESSKNVSVAPVVLDPAFVATPLSGNPSGTETVSAYFIANTIDLNTGKPIPGRIERTDGGSWSADGFTVNDLLRVGGSPNNSTSGGLTYTITKITDATTLTADAATAVSNNTINFGATNLLTGDVVTYHAVGAGIGGLVDGSQYYVNVQADGTVRLYDSEAHAVNGTDIGLKLLTAGSGTESFTTASTLTLKSSDVIFAETAESINITRGTTPTVKFVKVEQITPFTVDATGQIDVTAGGSVFLNSNIDINVDQVVAGSGNGFADNIRIKGKGSILDASGGTKTNVIGQDIVLEAANGSIGTHDSTDNFGTGGFYGPDGAFVGGDLGSPIRIDTVNDGTLTARTQGVVNIYQVAGQGTGTMEIESVFSSSANIYLTADNSILDGLHNDFVKIETPTHNIHLDAIGGSIGDTLGGPDYVEVQANQSFAGSIYATASGDIDLFETDFDLYIHNIVSQHGDVYLKAAAFVFDQANADQLNNLTSENPIADVLGNNITVEAVTGGIGLAGDQLDIHSHWSGPGALTAKTDTDLANIYIVQIDPAPFPDDLYLDEVQTGATHVAFITAPAGSILNSDKHPENVLGGNTLLFALNDIGADANRIKTQVGNLEAQSTTGSTWIDNNGDLSIGGTAISSDPIGAFAGGNATITAFSPVTVTKSMTVEGTINVIAADDSSSDNIVVNALDLFGNPLYLKAQVDINLLAGNNITIMGPTAGAPVGALLQAGNKITIKGDTDQPDASDADPGVGSVITVAGMVQAPTVEIDGGPNADVIKVTTGQIQAGFPWTAATWPFATPPVAPPLAVIAFPASPPTTSQIIINGNEGDDQVLLWGNISAKTINVNGDAGNDLIALNPTNSDGFNLTISGEVNLSGGAGDDTIVVNKLNTLDLAHKYFNNSGSPTSIDPGMSTPTAVNFTAGASTVDMVNSTINIGLNSGIFTGDKIVYDAEAHPAIGGLAQGGQYYARVQNGLLSLYDTQAHAVANDTTGLVTLTSVGSGAQQFTFPGVTSLRNTVNIDGGDGSNQYVVNLTGTNDNIINVHRNGDPGSGADTLTISGVPGVDTFLLRRNFVALLQTDPNAVQANPNNPLAFLQTYERVNYDATVNVLNVNGLETSDFVYVDNFGTVQQQLVSPAYAALSATSHSNFYVDDNSAITVLTGADGGSTYQFGQIFGTSRVGGSSVQFGDDVATIEVALGYSDVAQTQVVPGFLTRGISFSTTAYGGEGNDSFFVYSNKASLKLYGEDGNDNFVVRAFALLDQNLVSTSDTTIHTGDGSNHIEYNINAPVSIDGGNGVNTVTVLGSGFGDNFVITKDGVLGAGLNVTMTNIQILEVDGIAGKNNFYVLSTAPGEVVTLIGGTGNDTFNVAGDVTSPIIAQNVNGVSSFINHSVSSTDPKYNGIFANGVSVAVATGEAGTVIVGQLTKVGDPSTPVTQLFEDPASGFNEAQYTLKLAVPANMVATGTLAYVTVAAALRPYNDASKGSKSLEVSTDGIHFSQSLVLTFDQSNVANWNRTQTIYVRADQDTVAEGEQTIVISHAIKSTNAAFNQLPIANLEVDLVDKDQPDVVINQAHPGNLRVVEGSPTDPTNPLVERTDSYQVKLTRAPNPGETVTITLNSDIYSTANHLVLASGDAHFHAAAGGNPAFIQFTTANWNNAVTVTVKSYDGGALEDAREADISHTVTSTGGLYSGLPAGTHKVRVDVIDSEVPQVLVTPSAVPLVVSQNQTATYTMQLTTPPAAGTTVTISLLDDGKTITSSLDPRFTPATYDPVTHKELTPATVKFTNANGDWNGPITITIAVNPLANLTQGSQPVQVFPAQPHTLSGIQGPLIIEGDQIPNKDRSLRKPVELPTEIDTAPPAVVHPDHPELQTNTLNIFDDGSKANDTGVMGLASDLSGIAAEYAEPIASVNGNEFGNISGLDMGGNLVLDFGSSIAHDFRTFLGGITYRNVQVTDLMLGQGNDTFTVNATPVQPQTILGPDVDDSITVVQGGGGDDHLVANGGGGAHSALILLGDTTQDGRFYNTTTAALSANPYAIDSFGDHWMARSFPNPGNDTIDATNDPNSVVIYGGLGNDILTGGAGGDWIAGGSGNDFVNGMGGNDIIYGDDGFNLNLGLRMSLATQAITAGDDSKQVLTVVNANSTNLAVYTDGDPMAAAGQDTLRGGAASDIIFGDHGIITQALHTNRILTTGSVLGIANTRITDGANDTIYGDAGDDILMGGTGNDMIDGGLGRDLIFGDNVSLDRTNTLGNYANPRFRALNGTQIYDTSANTNAGSALVTAVSQVDPHASTFWGDFQVSLNDSNFGSDYIAGGGGDDEIFGQLGNDVIQGDGSIDITFASQLPAGLLANWQDGTSTVAAGTVGATNVDFRNLVGAGRDTLNNLFVHASVDNYAGAGTDGDDYIEGGPGSDTILGNLGQDDIIGGSSNLFSLTTAARRADGSDLLFGGSGGSDIARLDAGDTSTNSHASDADTIVADNGDIYRLVGVNGNQIAPANGAATLAGGLIKTSNGFLAFNYDDATYDASLKIVVRAVQLIDYTPGGPDFKAAAAATDIGAADEIHGGKGDDFVYGGKGNDVLFGDGQNDTIIGGYGADWISGGNGDDGILGDDGRLYLSRNSTSFGEPLYGIAAIPASQINLLISDSSGKESAVLNVAGQLRYTADLTPDNLDPASVGSSSPNTNFRPLYANDVIYGGLGNDSIHGGAGDDAILGGEAPGIAAYITNYAQNGNLVQVNNNTANKFVTESDFAHPFNPGNPLGFKSTVANPTQTSTDLGKFALYDANDPLRKIMLTTAGLLSKTGPTPSATNLTWFLDFNANEGPIDTVWVAGTNTAGVPTDGDDRIFGDLGNDWILGGTGRDSMYGGWGNDLLNADDNLETNGGLNNRTDTNPSYNDFVYGGSGLDVNIANTGADRMNDFTGEFNSFYTPYSNFGIPTVQRLPSPGVTSFHLQVARNDGADPTLAAQYSADPTRNGEPFGELGMVLQQDAAWGANNGNPRDPQAGNLQNKIDTTDNGLPLQQVVLAAAPSSTAVVTITQEELDATVTAAKQLWTEALGAGDPRLAALDQVTVLAGNLPSRMIGETMGAQIVIDRTAQGWGWFVDPTPLDNSEFTVSLGNGVFVASSSSAAYGRMDLLSTVLHELGNAMGFAEDTGQDVTGMVLQPGERRLPVAGQVVVQTSQNSLAASQPILVAVPPVGTTVAEFASSTTALTRFVPVSNIVLNNSPAFQPPPISVRGGDLGGSFVSLAAGLGGGTSASNAVADDAPAAPHSSHHASQAPAIKWDNTLDDVANLSAGPATGSQEWLDDFLNHMGQSQTQWNPNAGIRIRPANHA
jgi:Ca2+-binding RTX toxin-like protein